MSLVCRDLVKQPKQAELPKRMQDSGLEWLSWGLKVVRRSQLQSTARLEVKLAPVSWTFGHHWSNTFKMQLNTICPYVLPHFDSKSTRVVI